MHYAAIWTLFGANCYVARSAPRQCSRQEIVAMLNTDPLARLSPLSPENVKRGLGDTTDPRGDSKSAGCVFTKFHQLPRRMFCWMALTKISSELMMSDIPERINLVIRKSFNVLILYITDSASTHCRRRGTSRAEQEDDAQSRNLPIRNHHGVALLMDKMLAPNKRIRSPTGLSLGFLSGYGDVGDAPLAASLKVTVVGTDVLATPSPASRSVC